MINKMHEMFTWSTFFFQHKRMEIEARVHHYDGISVLAKSQKPCVLQFKTMFYKSLFYKSSPFFTILLFINPIHANKSNPQLVCNVPLLRHSAWKVRGFKDVLQFDKWCLTCLSLSCKMTFLFSFWNVTSPLKSERICQEEIPVRRIILKERNGQQYIPPKSLDRQWTAIGKKNATRENNTNIFIVFLLSVHSLFSPWSCFSCS